VRHRRLDELAVISYIVPLAAIMPELRLRAADNDTAIRSWDKIVIYASTVTYAVCVREEWDRTVFGDRDTTANAPNGNDLVLELRGEMCGVSVGCQKDLLSFDGPSFCFDEPSPVW
jgi:hypothetical protein